MITLNKDATNKDTVIPARRRLSFRLAYLLIATVVILLMVEGATRVLKLAPPLVTQYQGYVTDPVLPHKPRPLSTVTGRSVSDEFDFEHKHNSLGFRDVEHTLAKPDGVFRILGLGSSFTYGVGASFDVTSLSVLEKQLDARSGDHPKIEIIKAGIPNFAPEAQRLLLEHYGSQFEPDLILVDFSPAIVVDVFFGSQAIRVSKLGYLTTREAAELGEAAIWLYVHSHAARILLRKYVRHETGKGCKHDWSEVYKPNGLHERDWQKVESQYQQMVEFATRSDAGIAFVHIPAAGYCEARYSYPAQRLARWCAERNVPFVDTLPAMEVASAEQRVYWEEGHCTPAGYRVIAETVCRALGEGRLVP